jgi:hypothetical protein
VPVLMALPLALTKYAKMLMNVMKGVINVRSDAIIHLEVINVLVHMDSLWPLMESIVLTLMSAQKNCTIANSCAKI